MSVFEAIVLGVVQGLTEFLPVSSSGHLVLANYYFGFSGPGESLALAVDIATNTGTLLAVLIYLRRDVAMALGGFFAGVAGAAGRRTDGWRLALLVLAGSVPTAIIGLLLKEVFHSLNRPLPVALALIVTGLVLWFTPRSGTKKSPHDLTFRDALITGVAQGVAVTPGISRSGMTIATMLGRGAEGALAARFSFLLYLVASLGVALLGVSEVRGAQIPLAALAAMTVASFVTGYLALAWLFRLLRMGRFRMFAPYLWVIAVLTLVSLAVGIPWHG
ncbi:MAG TPA: undecaprenyl-diphosphate phosphatase [Trueperaceae bacterium]